MFEMPSNWNTFLPHFGIQGNYIYFEDDKVYYKQTTKLESCDYEPKGGENLVKMYCDDGQIVSLSVPIVTDVTDKFSSIDPVFEKTQCNYVYIFPYYNDAELYDMAYEAMQDLGVDYYEVDYTMPKIKVAFEV